MAPALAVCPGRVLCPCLVSSIVSGRHEEQHVDAEPTLPDILFVSSSVNVVGLPEILIHSLNIYLLFCYN